MSGKPAFQRILLKLSGEALMGQLNFGISPDVTSFLAHEIKGVIESGVQVALVVGGGNIFRGEGLAGREERIAGARREDHDAPLLEVPHRLAADVVLADLVDAQR